jgi:molybdate transport system permease protein
VSRRLFALILGVSFALALAFLSLPVAAIFVEAGPGELLASLGEPAALDALQLSLVCTGVAILVIIVIGTPAAYLLATRRFRGREAAITLLELPLVLPPPVAGIGLLAAFGPGGILGGAIEEANLRLVFETAGVVVALIFVASPFYLRATQAAFEAVDSTWVEASRTLGNSEMRSFTFVVVPAALPGMVGGLALAWGRALGEFGATLVFAGSLQGVTQTAPLAIVELFGRDYNAALALSAVLVALSAAVLLTIKVASRGWTGDAPR